MSKNLLSLVAVTLFSSILVLASNIRSKTVPVVEEESTGHLEFPRDQAENEEAFNTMMKVLTHPRCINCHPNDNIPKQGLDGHAHYFDMLRGDANLGYSALTCNTCHQEENNDFSGVPGAPEWSLAPASMAWEGLDKYEIARVMLDRSKNGNRSLAETEHHLTEHALVLWAWEPGIDANGHPREPVPVPLEEYREAVHQWIKGGAVIPDKKVVE